MRVCRSDCHFNYLSHPCMHTFHSCACPLPSLCLLLTSNSFLYLQVSFHLTSACMACVRRRYLMMEGVSLLKLHVHNVCAVTGLSLHWINSAFCCMVHHMLKVTAEVLVGCSCATLLFFCVPDVLKIMCVGALCCLPANHH